LLAKSCEFVVKVSQESIRFTSQREHDGEPTTWYDITAVLMTRYIA
jgi:hypothetical protein